MEERIRVRIAELEQAQQQALAQVNAICGALAELRALLAPDRPTLSGDPLSDPPRAATNGVEAHAP